MRGQIVLLDQEDPQAAARGIAGNACAVDPAADNKEVVGFVHCWRITRPTTASSLVISALSRASGAVTTALSSAWSMGDGVRLRGRALQNASIVSRASRALSCIR